MQTYTRNVHTWTTVGLAFALVFGLVLNAQPALAASVTVDQPVVGTGSVLVVRASGFRAGEPIVSWASSTRGTVYSTNGGGADSSGNIVLDVGIMRFWEPGYWAITVHGKDSGTEAVATFEVQAGPPNGPLDADVTVVRPGGRINFHGYGFKNNELVSVWITWPDGSAEKLKGSPLTALGAEVYFYYDTLPGALDGTWSVTAYGNESDRLLVATFDVVR